MYTPIMGGGGHVWAWKHHPPPPIKSVKIDEIDQHYIMALFKFSCNSFPSEKFTQTIRNGYPFSIFSDFVRQTKILPIMHENLLNKTLFSVIMSRSPLSGGDIVFVFSILPSYCPSVCPSVCLSQIL